MASTTAPALLTSQNLLRIGRGSSLTPSWAPTNASLLSPKSDLEILAFWKRARSHFKDQLFQLSKIRFGTPPVSPTLSEMKAAHRASVTWAEQSRSLQHQVEEHVPPLSGRIESPESRALKSHPVWLISSMVDSDGIDILLKWYEWYAYPSKYLPDMPANKKSLILSILVPCSLLIQYG